MSDCKYCGKEAKYLLGKNKDIPCCEPHSVMCPAIREKNASKQLIRPIRSPEVREKLRQGNLRRSKDWNQQNGERISQTVRRKVEKGEWHTSLAKHMHHIYRGIDLHGSWEVAYAKYLDSNKIVWERCKDRFSYEYQGKVRHYTPDFFLPSTGEYVEIKGYETEKDRAKWKQFPLKLIVLKRKELKELGICI